MGTFIRSLAMATALAVLAAATVACTIERDKEVTETFDGQGNLIERKKKTKWKVSSFQSGENSSCSDIDIYVEDGVGQYARTAFSGTLTAQLINSSNQVVSTTTESGSSSVDWASAWNSIRQSSALTSGGRIELTMEWNEANEPSGFVWNDAEMEVYCDNVQVNP